jgi:exopolysaccharide production protein ExoZ
VGKDNGRLVVIQYLRAVAALMVVVHHARNPAPWLFNPLEHYVALAWGVDIFFVISGFIMYVAARNETPSDFLARRLTRIVPLYWASTFALIFVATRFQPWTVWPQDVPHIVQSLLFIPHYSPQFPDKVWPYLIPGWTLNYEMLFYGLFCVGLVLRRPLATATVAIVVLVSAGLVTSPDGAVAKTYTAPILLEFICGAWIGYLYERQTLLRAAGWILAVSFIGLLSLSHAGHTVTTAGKIVFSALIIWSAVSLRRVPYHPLFKLLGDASYSIYLTHAVVSLSIAERVWRHVQVGGWPQLVSWCAVALVVSSLVGIATYLYVEKPLLRRLQRRRRTVLVPTGASQPLAVHDATR